MDGDAGDVLPALRLPPTEASRVDNLLIFRCFGNWGIHARVFGRSTAQLSRNCPKHRASVCHGLAQVYGVVVDLTDFGAGTLLVGQDSFQLLGSVAALDDGVVGGVRAVSVALVLRSSLGYNAVDRLRVREGLAEV